MATAIKTADARSRDASRPSDRFRDVTTAVATVAPATLVVIVFILLRQAWPSVTHFGLGFLTGRDWNPVTLQFGAWPGIFGTVATSLLALALAVPVGVAAALVLAEPGQQSLRAAVGTGIELLAAIPSVVFGIWALYVLGPWTYQHISGPIADRFSGVSWLSDASPRSLFTASLVLAVMILPTLTAVSRDVVRSIPRGLKENAVALGATWWETTWRVILPSARAGIFGATILALGRALGETIAVTMVIGNNYQVPPSIFSPAYTLAGVIANEFTEATGTLYPAALVELGLALILVTLTVNVIALLLVRSPAARSAV